MGGERFELGGVVLHRGRKYVVRGYSRLSGDDQYLAIEDLETGLRLTVPADEAFVEPVQPLEAPPQPAF